MIIVFVAGGTMGHISPTIPVIDSLNKKDNVDIYFITTLNAKKFNIENMTKNIKKIVYYDISGFNKNKFLVIKKILQNSQLIKTQLKHLNPDIVIGMGGAISGVVLRIAKKLGKKIMIHEQNSVLGLANQLLLRDVQLILSAMEIINLPLKYKSKEVIIGNPVSPKKNEFKDEKHILFTSGSNGAKAINNMAIDFIKSSYGNDYLISVVTGKKYYKEVLDQLKTIKKQNFEIIPYTLDLRTLISRCKIVVCRSGASTSFEVINEGSIPIFIPSPNVKRNHQYFNAKYFVTNNFGQMIEEKDLNIERLIKAINSIKNSKSIDYKSRATEDFCYYILEVLKNGN